MSLEVKTGNRLFRAYVSFDRLRTWHHEAVIPLLLCDSLWKLAMMGRLTHDQGQLFC